MKKPSPKSPVSPSSHSAMLAVFERIAHERLRQRELWRAGKLNVPCDSPIADENRKLRVLTVGVGNVATTLAMLERGGRQAEVFNREDLQDQLTKLAASATAWLESLEAQS